MGWDRLRAGLVEEVGQDTAGIDRYMAGNTQSSGRIDACTVMMSRLSEAVHVSRVQNHKVCGGSLPRQTQKERVEILVEACAAGGNRRTAAFADCQTCEAGAASEALDCLDHVRTVS